MGTLLAGLIYITGYLLQGPTASGVYTHPGLAACPYDVRFGTRLQIEGVGVVTCEDHYAPYLSDRVDVWVPDLWSADNITGLHAVTILP